MKQEKTMGLLLITGAIGVLIPYTVLTHIFDYPAVLREQTGVVLTRFYVGGSVLIWTWWAFAMLGLPLLIVYVWLGQLLEKAIHFVRWVTVLGVVGLLVQMLGLLRWTFVVPILATYYMHGNDTAKIASEVAFQVIHQYGGVALGEHVGQLFTIVCTIMMTRAFDKLQIFTRWVVWLGYATGLVYLMGQTELFATVLAPMPVIAWAGFVGSTLWIIWLCAVGVYLYGMTLNIEKIPPVSK